MGPKSAGGADILGPRVDLLLYLARLIKYLFSCMRISFMCVKKASLSTHCKLRKCLTPAADTE